MEIATLTKQQALVKEIHDTFDYESDFLVSEAERKLIQLQKKEEDVKKRFQADTSKFDQMIESIHYPSKEKAEKLESLGFTSAEIVRKYDQAFNEAYKEERALREERDRIAGEYNKEDIEIWEHKKVYEKALYYKKKYPFLKFITEKQLDGICKKYNLIYCPVGNYTGNVPDKNLEEIANCPRIDYYDGYERHEEYTHIDYYNVLTGRVFYRAEEDTKKVGLFIAADKAMFNLKGLEKSKNGFGFFKKHIPNPDPIVFRYVKGGILIISKWGLEASDPELTVPEMN